MIETELMGLWLNTLASKAPVPGGGGASAIGGALAAALGQMVANLTVGKKKYADAEETMQELLGKLQALQKAFLNLADQDAKAFAPLAAAYALPASTEEEKQEKARIMEENLLAASLVPLHMMEKAAETLEFLEVLGEKGSRMAVSDVGVAVQFARTALTGAVMNEGGDPGAMIFRVLYRRLLSGDFHCAGPDRRDSQRAAAGHREYE